MLLTILAIFALQDGEAIRRTKVCADGSVLLESQPCPGEDVVELTCALRAYAAQKPSHVTIRLDPAARLALVRYQTMPWPEQKAELTVLPDAFVVATPSRPNGTRARFRVDRSRWTVTEEAHSAMLGTSSSRDGSCTASARR